MTRRWNTMRWAVAPALVMLILTLHGSDAFARAGSGGSRGSRSYSTPARPPASPVSPSNPSRQSNSPTQQPMQPQPSRGLFGPIMGGLAGFALGGLLGGLLFGGLGGGFGSGFGLMDMLLIGGALFLLFRFMKARRAQQTPQPAYAGASGYGAANAGADVAYPVGGVATATPEPPSELEGGVAYIRQMDPGFDPGKLAETARALFPDVQRAVSARDMSAVSARLTPRMYTTLTAQCDRLRGSRQTNRLEQIEVRRAEVSEAWQESGQDYVTVYLTGSLVDYTVDDASGGVIEGNRAAQEFNEYWTFSRPVGPNPWKLSAIQTE